MRFGRGYGISLVFRFLVRVVLKLRVEVSVEVISSWDSNGDRFWGGVPILDKFRGWG